MTRIEGSVAMVTGAAGGIGSAVADELRAGGATVVGVDLAGADIVLDVTDAAAVDRIVGDIVRTHGRLDIAVTAAGLGIGGPFEELDLDEWTRCVDVNLWGTVHVVRAAYTPMRDHGGGHLALIASLSGLVPTPLLVPYATTKTAVVGLAAALRPEARRHSIGVSAICPGPVDTRMLDDGGKGGSVHGVDPRRYLTNAAGPALAPADVGRATVKAIERDAPIVAPGRARLIYAGARFAPRLVGRVISRSMRQELAASTRG